MEEESFRSPARRSKLLAADKLNTSAKKKSSVVTSPIVITRNSQEDAAVSEQSSTASTPVRAPKLKEKNLSNRIISSPTVPKSPPVTKHKATTNVDLDECEDGDLYSAVLKSGSAPQVLVDNWIEEYKSDYLQGIVNLFQFFVTSSGCQGTLSKEVVEQSSMADMVRQLTLDFDEDSSDYPLIKTGPLWKKFKSHFTDFLIVLIRQCQYNIIFDNVFLDRVVQFLTTFSDSQVRPFRHTATLAGLMIVSSLIDVSHSLNLNRANMQRQYQAERKKPEGQRNSDRLENLLETINGLDSNEEELTQSIMALTKGIFVHRYRDVCPAIRNLCMQELGVWMRKMPSVFLSDGYLKYVGWTLYDRVGSVRLTCLKSLLPMYQDSDQFEHLQLFTSRFKNRLLQMTMDKESEVAVEAVKLLTKLVEISDTALEQKDCESIYEFVFGSQKEIAKAAGQFLFHKCFKKDPIDRSTLLNNKKKVNPNQLRLRELLDFLIESEFHEHAAYLVDSLWNCGDMLRDWESILAELTETREPPMSAEQETLLLDILVCSVKQAITGDSPVGRQAATGHHLKLKKQRDARRLVNDRNRFTQILLSTLPDLLLQYGISNRNLILLLQLPLYMNLELYITERQERKLDLLLKHLHDIVMKNSDEEILLKCSQVYESLCDESLNIAAKCENSRGTLLDDIVTTYQEATVVYLQQSEESEDIDLESRHYNILTALKRLLAFSSCHDLSGLDLTIGLYTLARDDLSQQCVISHAVIAKSLSAAALNFMWKYHRIQANPQQEEIIQLSNSLLAYVNMCTTYMSHPSHLVSEEAYLSVCDFLVVFSKHCTESEEDNYLLGPLTFQPDTDTVEALTNFLIKRVFIEDEENDDDELKLESLHKRRNYLACYCKLCILNIIPIKESAVIYQHYLTHFNDFADIMKATLAKLRQINRVTTAQMFTIVLKNEYLILEGDKNVEIDGGTLIPLRELAKRLNLSFGLDLMRIREGVIALHTKGIQFCAERYREENCGQHPPSNIFYLDLLVEFSGKLLRQDKADLAKYISKVFPRANLNSKWESFHHYLTSLDSKLQRTAGGDHSGIIKRRDPNLTGNSSFSSPKRRKSVVKFSSTPSMTLQQDNSAATSSRSRMRRAPDRIEEDEENLPPTSSAGKRKQKIVLDQSEFKRNASRAAGPLTDSVNKGRSGRFGSMSTIGSPLADVTIEINRSPTSTKTKRSKRLLNDDVEDTASLQSPNKRRSLRSRNAPSYAE